MVNYERLASKAQSAPSICSDVSQFVRKKSETKVIAQILTTILQGLLFRGQQSCLLSQTFFFFPLRILQKLQPSCSWVLEPITSSNLPLRNKTKAKENKKSQRSSFAQKAGILQCLEQCLRPAPTELKLLHGDCRHPWSLSKGKILEVPSPLWKLWHRVPPVLKGDTHATVIPWSSIWGFKSPSCTVLPAQALFEIDGKPTSNSRFLPRAPVSPPGLFCHSLIKELSEGYRVLAALRRSLCLSQYQRPLEVERILKVHNSSLFNRWENQTPDG